MTKQDNVKRHRNTGHAQNTITGIKTAISGLLGSEESRDMGAALGNCLGMMRSYFTESPLPTPIQKPDCIKTVVDDSLYELYGQGNNSTLEVIFFHGLQLFDYREAYWTTFLSRDNKVLWPNAWLGPHLKNARILSVSYDSAARRTASCGKMDLYRITENLMQDLTRADNDCPKILVGHSLGGLIIKKLLLDMNNQAGELSSTDPRKRKLENFVNNCRGVVYYATPHAGSELADITNKIPNFKPNAPIISLLQVLGEETARINNKFSNFRRIKNIMTRCVAESRETNLFGFSRMVVKEGSSRHDLDLNYTDPDADHFEVPKPKTTTSTAFTYLLDLCVMGVPEAKLSSEEERLEESRLLV